jgi:hypothetical protein
MGMLMELGAADPLPAYSARGRSRELPQGFWRGPQGSEKHVLPLKGLALAADGGRHLHNPAGADPGLADMVGAPAWHTASS